MMTSYVDALTAVRDIVFEKVPADLRFAFDFIEAEDLSPLQAGPLFRQDADFVLFEAEVDTSRRAGPSQVSPTRWWGTLAIAVNTKKIGQDIPYQRQLEQLANWFAEQTINDIRFRTFTPLSMSRVRGFASYSGVLNFDFETAPKGVSA